MRRVKQGKIEKKKREKPLTVLFVPRTWDGELSRRLKKKEQELEEAGMGMPIKFVERNGKTLNQILHKSDPWAGGECGRESCCQYRTEEGKFGPGSS